MYGSAQQLDSTTRIALSVQKMEIFDTDFKQLFENNAAFNQLQCRELLFGQSWFYVLNGPFTQCCFTT